LFESKPFHCEASRIIKLPTVVISLLLHALFVYLFLSLANLKPVVSTQVSSKPNLIQVEFWPQLPQNIRQPPNLQISTHLSPTTEITNIPPTTRPPDPPVAVDISLSKNEKKEKPKKEIAKPVKKTVKPSMTPEPMLEKTEVAKEVEPQDVERIRQEQLDYIAQLAKSGEPPNTNTPANKLTPGRESLDTYAEKVRAAVKPNIIYGGSTSVHIQTLVEIITSPIGEILSIQIIKSSGVITWDNAVRKALERTRNMPKDTDGTVPKRMLLQFSPSN
jgi:colicin import membrane protein